MASVPNHTFKAAPQELFSPMFRNGISLSYAFSISHAFTSLLRFHSHSGAHCAATKVDDDDEDVEEESLMCRSTFEMHFILGLLQTLCYWEHSFVLMVSFRMIVISIGKCQHIAERFVVLRA